MKPMAALGAAVCYGGAWAAWLFCVPPLDRALAVMAGAAGTWLFYCALSRTTGAVLRLWGLDWTRDEVCTHFFITGATGTGKTARAVVPILHGLRETMPDTGILAIDSKGALWQPLAEMARALGQEDDLRLIRVRPTGTPRELWQPPLTLNVFGDPSVPAATYAKMLVDTASAAGQRGGQAFFRETARDAITHAMIALDLVDLVVTPENVHNVICISKDTEDLVNRLQALSGPAVEQERQFFEDFAEQPPEQKSGTVWTVANYLRAYTPPDIAEVFCSNRPNFSLAEIDQGKLVCLSVPQTYQVERKYLNLLCKQLFFLHAFRRFDLAPEEMRRRNVIALVLDEGQKTTLVSEDGFSDHLAVDELREAGVCLISATQTPLSLYAAFDQPNKADVFMANLRTQVHFRAADEKGAKIISEKMGGRETRKYSGGHSGGKAMRNWQLNDQPWFKPAKLLALPDGQALIRHPRRTGKPLVKKLPYTNFTLANKLTRTE
ncbi:MAG: type IV secretion system DNA-binding domain-containing protein [Candidatus Didemnitutus sp.]|nr:type IV secretion system DNA-binding domain-containing protein [Candidatus Didemnitutus sp.]